MKNILILSRKDDRESYDNKPSYTKALEGIDTKCSYTIDEYENLLFWYDGNELKVQLGNSGVDIASFDAVFLVGWFQLKIHEDMALSISKYLSHKGVKVVNSEASFVRSKSKLSQYVVAAVNDISITPFLFSMTPSVLAAAITEKWQYGYPVIMKGVQSSRGNDNYLVETAEEAHKYAYTMKSDHSPWFVVQQFIPNEGDYRIVVMGDAVTAVIHRRSVTDSHLNNTSKGGEAQLSDASSLPQEVVDQSVKLAGLLHREVTGVDMIRKTDTQEFYLLEINNMPQLATGSYVTDKLQRLDNYFAELDND